MESVRLQTVDLSVGYKSPLFSSLNLTLKEGSITALIGRNGSGKSTLIRTLSGIQKPLSGSLFLQQTDMAKMSEKEVAKLLSVVLTIPVKVPFMTVSELVALGRYPHLGGQIKMTEHDNFIVNQAIKDVEIDHLKERYIATLSDGERQKAALARSLAQQTDLILLDEPAAFLDFPSKMELMQLLRTLAQQFSKSILFSTHDIEMAIALSNNIWLMDKNNALITGTPAELIENDVISKTFDTTAAVFNKKEKRFIFC